MNHESVIQGQERVEDRVAGKSIYIRKDLRLMVVT